MGFILSVEPKVRVILQFTPQAAERRVDLVEVVVVRAEL